MREAEQDKCRSIFRSRVTMKVYESDLMGFLRRIGYLPTSEQLADAMHQANLNALRGQGAGSKTMEVEINDLLMLARKYREAAVPRMRETAGFDDREIARLRQTFEYYDVDRSDGLTRREVERLLDEVLVAGRRKSYAALGKASEKQAKLEAFKTEVMSQVDDAVGGLDFQDFLILMRQHQDEEEEIRYKKEAMMIEKTGFSREEVEEWRTLFKGIDVDNDGALNLVEIRLLLKPIINVIDEFVSRRLEQLVWQSDIDQDGKTDFPEFLLLARMILDEDLGKVREKAEEEVTELRKEKKRHVGTKAEKETLAEETVVPAESPAAQALLKRRLTDDCFEQETAA